MMLHLLVAADQAAAQSSVSGVSVILLTLLPILLALIVYFIPTVIAVRKQHTNKTAIILLNVFLGWTFIGWVVALIWSVMKKDK